MKLHDGHLLKLDSKTRIATQDGNTGVLQGICAGVADALGTSTPQPICFRAAIAPDVAPRSPQAMHLSVDQPFITVQVGQRAGRGGSAETGGVGDITGRRRREVGDYLARIARDLDEILQGREGEHPWESVADACPREVDLTTGNAARCPVPAVQSGPGRATADGLENERLSGIVIENRKGWK